MLIVIEMDFSGVVIVVLCGTVVVVGIACVLGVAGIVCVIGVIGVAIISLFSFFRMLNIILPITMPIMTAMISAITFHQSIKNIEIYMPILIGINPIPTATAAFPSRVALSGNAHPKPCTISEAAKIIRAIAAPYTAGPQSPCVDISIFITSRFSNFSHENIPFFDSCE